MVDSIGTTLDLVFPKLNTTDKLFLNDKLQILTTQLLLRWQITYTFSETDIQSLLKIILPGVKNSQNLIVLENLSLVKDKDKYVFSNVQYSRCVRYMKNELEIGTIERPHYSDYINHNCQLLLETIDLVANQLYVNWFDILPVHWSNLENSIECIAIKNKLDYDPDNPKTSELINILKTTYSDPLPGISMNVIYQTIHNIYYQIKPAKWLIFDLIYHSINNSIAFQITWIIL